MLRAALFTAITAPIGAYVIHLTVQTLRAVEACGAC